MGTEDSWGQVGHGGWDQDSGPRQEGLRAKGGWGGSSSSEILQLGDLLSFAFNLEAAPGDRHSNVDEPRFGGAKLCLGIIV